LERLALYDCSGIIEREEGDNSVSNDDPIMQYFISFYGRDVMDEQRAQSIYNWVDISLLL
jgi:hypothetical protein